MSRPAALRSALERQEYRIAPWGSLALHPKNARRGSVAKIVESIRLLGWFGACGLQRSSGLAIWGNHRYLAGMEARALMERAASGAWEARDEAEAELIESWRSWPERFGALDGCPVFDIDCDDELAESILLSDNAASDAAAWDRPALASQLAEIDARRQSLLGTGFERPDYEALMEEARANLAASRGAPEDAPLLPESLRGEDTDLHAPFPWFGGKRRVSRVAWAAFGDVPNFVEPFAGSLAVLLGRPGGHRHRSREVVNDADGFVANFWRALRDHPEEVAAHADWPVLENDVHARAAVLAERRAELTTRLEGDPAWCDPEVAGWWVWGVCSALAEFPPTGPWVRVDGKLERGETPGAGIARGRPDIANGSWTGINRGGVSRKRPNVKAQGISRQIPHTANGSWTGNRGSEGGADDRSAWLLSWFSDLADRLRGVVVCCGDWTRVTGNLVTMDEGGTAIFLDPPYSDPERSALYAVDDFTVAKAVRTWAAEAGEDPKRRIVLCGYVGEEPAMPPSWRCYAWSAGTPGGGHGENAAERRHRERLWLSPGCLPLPSSV